MLNSVPPKLVEILTPALQNGTVFGDRVFTRQLSSMSIAEWALFSMTGVLTGVLIRRGD